MSSIKHSVDGKIEKKVGVGNVSNLQSIGNDLEPPYKKMTPKNQQKISSNTTSETLAEYAQSIIDEMGVKRKNDENILAEFRKSIEVQTENWLESLQSSLSKLYKRNNDSCQDKIQELYTILGRINLLEQEMTAFKQSLKLLYDEVEIS